MDNNETNEYILARLILAQQILEESDNLPGRGSYDLNKKKFWLHPRHEREALVVYLLLTCFDKLGQHKKHTTFIKWLEAKKEPYRTEKNDALKTLSPSATPVESSIQLNKKYQELYGVKNAFFSGIVNLEEAVKKRFLKSLSLTHCPRYGENPNTSYPSYPLWNKKEEEKLKLLYLYNKRNEFTHKLKQYHTSSSPFTSDLKFKNGPSWRVMIEKSKLFYTSTHTERTKLPEGGAYCYSMYNWPFILFETLYDAIKVQFDRTEINLTFQVEVWHENENKVTTYNGVKHKNLKNYKTNFLKNQI